MALAALLLHFAPAAGDKLVYLRSVLLAGDWWRLWSGHLIHFGGSHLAWNLLLFVPAGLWLERVRPVPTRLYYLAGPAVISLLLLACDPSLERYAGLSGLVAGQISLLALIQLRAGPPESRVWWLAVLVLLTAKIVWEWHTGAPLLIQGLADLRSVPLAHLGGALTGALFGWLSWPRLATK